MNFACVLLRVGVLGASVGSLVGCGAESEPARGALRDPIEIQIADPVAIAASPEGRVYVSSRPLVGTGALRRISEDGAATSLIARAASELTASSSRICLAEPRTSSFSQGGVECIPAMGGEPTSFAKDADAVGLAFDATHLYWLDAGGGLYRQGWTDTDPTKLLAASDAWGGLRADVDYVYWIHRTGMARLRKAGGPEEEILTAEECERAGVVMPRQFVVSGDYVYAVGGAGWASPMPTSGVYRFRKGGGEFTVLARDQSFAAAVAVDAHHVYWSRGESNRNLPRGGNVEVVRMPLGGGDIEILAVGQNGVASIALTDTHVWWVNTFAGVVARTRK